MSELDEQIQNRREKRQGLKEAGIAPYPHRFDLDAEPSEIQASHGEKSAEDLDAEGLRLRSAGRVQGLRRHGKLAFMDIHDGKGKIQLMVRINKLSDEGKKVVEGLDLGDYLGALGALIRTRTGELTLLVEELTFLSKALRPLPEKWHGLSDVEARYRRRYLDLATNPESVAVFETRARVIRELRRYLDDHGFLEVETPMMHPLAGGATARPFKTHHNTLDMELYLRIAPELYLKRLLVGGMHRVYEINRNFRNEGISTQHNPEFTMLEFYWAYVDFEVQMEFTEAMLSSVAAAVLGEQSATWEEQEISFARPWARYTMKEACRDVAGVAAERLEDIDGLTAELEERKIPLPKVRGYGHLLMTLFEETVEDHLFQPTFITHHPVEISPLAKEWPEDPRFTERFELYMAGMEVANAFSELNDPDVQAERFHQQLEAREAGDQEAHQFDADYIRALEHGLPPAGGNGIGIDRLTMVLTGSKSIRDVILFPLLRRESAEDVENP